MASGSLAAGAPGQIDPARLHALQAQEGTRAALAMQRLEASKATLGLQADDQFLKGRVGTDATGTLHVHLHQTYRGVPVWGGDAILHMDAEGVSLPASDKLVRGLDMAVAPALDGSEALSLATRDMQPKDGLSYTSEPKLVILPRIVRSLRAGVTKAGANAADVVTAVTGGELAYHLHLETRSQDDTRDMDYLISAATGAILKKWSSLETGAVQGTGNSQYSGTVSLTTNQLSASSYEMRDPNRGSTTLSGFGATAGSVVTDMGNGTSGNGTLYTDADNTWGDGNNFYDGSTTGGTSGVTGQTAAVDAKFGFDATWDYYKNVHGRNGIDNNGTSTKLRMHYRSNYDNAFWSDSCFCMTFGDGSAPAPRGLKNVTALDVIGHELSHGVIANSVAGGLNYYDESGGLNEADSDINGTFITYYGYNGATGSTVPQTIPAGNLHGYTPWQIGSQLSNSPLRYMYKPSLDGASPDAWYFDIGSLDVHYSSGPMNRAMYFLANGSTASGDMSSPYLPAPMAGIGNDKASRIWYSVMTNYLTSSSTYHDARLACIAAAKALYNGTETSPSTELAAVQDAFAAINVGPLHGNTDDAQAPTGVTASENGTSGTISLSATASDNVGVAHVDFTIDGIVMAGMTGTGAMPFDSHLLVNGGHSMTATAYDAYRNKTVSAPISFSTLNSYSQFLVDPGFEQGGVNWGFGGNQASISTSPTYAHGGSNYAIIGAAGATGESYGYQILPIPAGAPEAKLTVWVRISNTGYPTTDTTDTMEIAIYDATLSTQKASLGALTGKDATGTSVSGAHWVQVGPFDLSAYKGQTIGVVFDSICNAGATTFRIDDAALNAQYAKTDENGDGKVDGIDLGIFAKGYGADPLSDFNNDGSVNDADATILLNAFGQ